MQLLFQDATYVSGWSTDFQTKPSSVLNYNLVDSVKIKCKEYGSSPPIQAACCTDNSPPGSLNLLSSLQVSSLHCYALSSGASSRQSRYPISSSSAQSQALSPIKSLSFFWIAKLRAFFRFLETHMGFVKMVSFFSIQILQLHRKDHVVTFCCDENFVVNRTYVSTC